MHRLSTQIPSLRLQPCRIHLSCRIVMHRHLQCPTQKAAITAVPCGCTQLPSRQRHVILSTVRRQRQLTPPTTSAILPHHTSAVTPLLQRSTTQPTHSAPLPERLQSPTEEVDMCSHCTGSLLFLPSHEEHATFRSHASLLSAALCQSHVIMIAE